MGKHTEYFAKSHVFLYYLGEKLNEGTSVGMCTLQQDLDRIYRRLLDFQLRSAWAKDLGIRRCGEIKGTEQPWVVNATAQLLHDNH